MTITPKIKALLSGVAVLLIAGGAAAAVIVTRSVAGPLALRQAFVETGSASPFSVSAKIQVADIADTTKMLTVNVSAEGVGSSEPSKGTVSLSGTVPGELGSALSAALEWRRIAPDTYIKLAPGLSIPDFPFDPEAFTGRWVVLSDSDENGGAQELVSGMSPIAFPDCSPAKLQTVMKSIDSSSFVTVGSTSLTEVENAPREAGTVYTLTIDSIAMQSALEAALVKAECDSSEPPQNIGALKDVTVTVGQETGYIRAFSGSMQEEGVTVTVNAAFSGFGMSPTVEAPPSAVTFEQLVNEAFSSMFGSEMPSP